MSKQSAEKIWMPAVWVLAVAIVGVAAIAGSSHLRTRRARNSNTQVPASATQSGRVRPDLDAFLLAFEANQGQTDPQVKYMARGRGYTAFLTADETVFAMETARANAGITGKRALLSAQKIDKATKDETGAIRMKLVGANENAPIAAENELPGHSNYFIGNDRSQWHAGVKQYARVSYNQVYRGVNLAFHGQQKQLEFDFIVAPGADPKAIRFNVAGAKKISSDSTGNLVLSSTAGDVVLHKPVTYQTAENTRQAVDSRFVVAKNTVSFEVADYDRRRELVIDPAVSYATFLGGTAEDDAYGIAVDSSGNAYVTGQTASTSFPGATGTNKGIDAFVSKISSDGKTIEWSTYVGGSGSDSGNGLALDTSFNVYVVGGTTSSDFPGTSSGFQPSAGGGTDAMIFEVSNSGSLMFATYLGGTQDDIGYGIAVDGTGVYVAGTTNSTGLATAGAFQTALSVGGNGFVAKANAAGTAKLYFSYLGAGGESLSALDVYQGKVYVTGSAVNSTFPVKTPYQATCKSCTVSDAFVSVINPAGSGANDLVYSTFLGGSGLDQGMGVAVDKTSGNVYVTGVTQSSDFPVLSSLRAFGGLQNAFVTALNPSATGAQQLLYSTYLGGTNSDFAAAIALDSSHNAYVTGETNSSDFPATQGALKGGKDAFVSEISPAAKLLFSTFLGGSQDENVSGSGNLTGIAAIALDNTANIYIAGNTASSDFPATAGSAQPTYGGTGDAFVAKYSTGASSANFTITNGALSPTSGHAGVSANATVTVTSTAGFSSAVALTCSVFPAVTKGPTCSLSPASVTPPANSTATSTLTVSTTAAATPTGAYTITVTGTSGGASATGSPALTLTVNATAAFTITNGALSPSSVHAGLAASAAITVTSTGGFSAPVALTCGVTPAVANGPTCSLTPASVTPAPDGTVTSTLSVATTPATARLETPLDRHNGTLFAMVLPVFGIPLLVAGMGSSDSHRKKLLGVFLLGMLMMSLFLMAACSSTTITLPQLGGKTGTPQGAYTITITGSGGLTVTGSPVLILTVN